jgi:hypothetical protein
MKQLTQRVFDNVDEIKNGINEHINNRIPFEFKSEWKETRCFLNLLKQGQDSVQIDEMSNKFENILSAEKQFHKRVKLIFLVVLVAIPILAGLGVIIGDKFPPILGIIPGFAFLLTGGGIATLSLGKVYDYRNSQVVANAEAIAKDLKAMLEVK